MFCRFLVADGTYTRTNNASNTATIPCYPPDLPIDILPPRNLKLDPNPIANHPFLTEPLMQVVEDSNRGERVTPQRNLLWIKEGRGE